MGYILALIIGGIIGVVIGTILMCLLQINKENEVQEYVQDIRQLSYYINTRINQAKKLEPNKVEGMVEVQKIYDYYWREELQ